MLRSQTNQFFLITGAIIFLSGHVRAAPVSLMDDSAAGNSSISAQVTSPTDSLAPGYVSGNRSGVGQALPHQQPAEDYAEPVPPSSSYSHTPVSAPDTMRSLGTLTREDMENYQRRDMANQQTDPAFSGQEGALQAKQAGGVTFITGGIGDEERSELESVQNAYNTHVMSAYKAGDFAGNTRIEIFDRQGQELVNTNAGPLFYANLPPGSYTIEATNDQGRTNHQRITVNGRKPVSVRMSW